MLLQTKNAGQKIVLVNILRNQQKLIKVFHCFFDVGDAVPSG